MCFKLATCADFTRPCISDFDELFSVYAKPKLVGVKEPVYVGREDKQVKQYY